MIHEDTIKLLHECENGLEMGIGAIEQVKGSVQDYDFANKLTTAQKEHRKLRKEALSLLEDYHDSDRPTSVVAKSMAWIETKVKQTMKPSDKTIADIITDGCDMGVKSLNRYLNEYTSADAKSKAIAKKIIKSEQKLEQDIKEYL